MQVKSELGDTSSAADVARELGRRWKEMSPEAKVGFEEQGKQDRERYEAEMKEYKVARDKYNAAHPELQIQPEVATDDSSKKKGAPSQDCGLARRFSMPAMVQPPYQMSAVPRAQRDLEGSVIMQPSCREEWVHAMGELVLLCNEAVARAKRRASQNGKPPKRLRPGEGDGSGGKPLSLEYIADRLDVDSPMHGYMVRTKEGNMLQGFVTTTNFTTWQRHFRWDSAHPQVCIPCRL